MSEATIVSDDDSDYDDLTEEDYTALADELFQQLDRAEAAAGKTYEGWIDVDTVIPEPKPDTRYPTS